MLWDDLSSLGGIERPRSWHFEGWGDTRNPRSRPSFTILGQEWLFRKAAFLEDVLKRAWRELNLDSDNWKDQRDFLTEFGCRAFRSTDGPAWIQVIGERKGFGTVNQEGSQHKHIVVPGPLPVPLQELRRSTIALKGQQMPYWPVLASLRAAGGVTLLAQRVFILRWITDENRRLRQVHERLIVTTDDPEDMALVAQGITPAIEAYRDCDDVNRSPLITFLRLDDRDRRVVSRVAGFDASGTLRDLRVTDDTPEFFFKSNMFVHHFALEQVLKRGEYEAY